MNKNYLDKQGLETFVKKVSTSITNHTCDDIGSSNLNNFTTAASVKSYVNDTLNNTLPHPDWNENDSNSPNYIQNRTHYEVKGSKFDIFDLFESEPIEIAGPSTVEEAKMYMYRPTDLVKALFYDHMPVGELTLSFAIDKYRYDKYEYIDNNIDLKFQSKPGGRYYFADQIKNTFNALPVPNSQQQIDGRDENGDHIRIYTDALIRYPNFELITYSKFEKGSFTYPNTVSTKVPLDEKFVPETIARTSDIPTVPENIVTIGESEGVWDNVLKCNGDTVQTISLGSFSGSEEVTSISGGSAWFKFGGEVYIEPEEGRFDLAQMHQYIGTWPRDYYANRKDEYDDQILPIFEILECEDEPSVDNMRIPYYIDSEIFKIGYDVSDENNIHPVVKFEDGNVNIIQSKEGIALQKSSSYVNIDPKGKIELHNYPDVVEYKTTVDASGLIISGDDHLNNVTSDTMIEWYGMSTNSISTNLLVPRDMGNIIYDNTDSEILSKGDTDILFPIVASIKKFMEGGFSVKIIPGAYGCYFVYTDTINDRTFIDIALYTPPVNTGYFAYFARTKTPDVTGSPLYDGQPFANGYICDVFGFMRMNDNTYSIADMACDEINGLLRGQGGQITNSTYAIPALIVFGNVTCVGDIFEGGWGDFLFGSTTAMSGVEGRKTAIKRYLGI